MLFNGVDLSSYFRIKEIRGRGLIDQELGVIRTTGMDGEYVGFVRNPARMLEVDIRIIGKNIRKTIDELNGILATDEPVPIVFPDEPDKTYYGVVESNEETKDYVFLNWHDATIFIRRPDPYKYGEEKQVNFSSDTVVVENQGTAPADPIFELEVNEPTTFAMVSNGDEYMMVGRPVDVDETEFVREELILRDTLSNTNGWTEGTVVQNGVVSGTMQSDGNEFRAMDYGSGTQWHGPALKRSFPEPLQDFRLDAFLFNISNNANQVGRIEFYLLDVNNNVVARLGMRDSKTAQELNEGYISVTDGEFGRYIIYETGDHPGVWNDFRGILRLERIGNEFTAYIAKQNDDGTHHARRTIRFRSNDGRYMQQVAQIQIHIAAYGNNPTPSNLAAREIRVWKINDPADNQVPYIAQQGDLITFDHRTGDCYINGEPVPFDFGGDFFKLRKGYNTLAVSPENTFSTSLKYRERYR